MALPPLATVADLEKRLGETLTGADRDRAEEALSDASALVRAEARRRWVDPDGVLVPPPDAVVTVVKQAATRAYRNPEGYAAENLGEYGYRLEAVGVYLTDEEKRVVRAASVGWGGTGSIRTPSAYPRDPATGTLYVSDGGAGDLIPWEAP